MSVNTVGNPATWSGFGMPGNWQGSYPSGQFDTLSAGPPGSGYAAPSAPSPGSDILMPQYAIDAEAEASTSFMREVTRCIIPQLSAYVIKHRPSYPQLARAVEMATRATDLYAKGNYASAFNQVYQAYRQIEGIRVQHPNIPDPSV